MDFAIAGRPIEANAPSFVIAEAGVNHNGDVALARRLIDVATDAGADAVKFQTWKTDLVIHRSAPKAEYQKYAVGEEGGQFEMVKGLELTQDDFRGLARYAEKRGIIFLSTPFDVESLRFLVEIGVPAMKVPSGEIDNRLLLRPLAKTGLPVIVSTGMATLGEVSDALDILRTNGSGPLAVLQCTSNYPANPADANLRTIPTMAAALGVPVGYSDHTLGGETALAARALGACIFEKHFTLDKTLMGPDHQASANPEELAAYVAGLRMVEKALGRPEKRPSASESDVKAVARRSLYLTRAVTAGEPLTEENVTALRPAAGIPPSHVDFILGRCAVRDLMAGHRLDWTDLG